LWPMLEKENGSKALVFCNTHDAVDIVTVALRQLEFNCEGFTKQKDRSTIIERFKDPADPLKLLVCTHVLGRGLDFQQLRYVINYDMPRRRGSRSGILEYIHRIGRTGRGGEKGYALTLLTQEDLVQARDLVDCLRETGKVPPPWLVHATTRKQQMLAKQLLYGESRGDEPTAALRDQRPEPPSNPWYGRGRGRQQNFIERVSPSEQWKLTVSPTPKT